LCSASSRGSQYDTARICCFAPLLPSTGYRSISAARARTIRRHTRCILTCAQKLTGQLNIPHGTTKLKRGKQKKIEKSKKKRLRSEVSVNSPGNPWSRSSAANQPLSVDGTDRRTPDRYTYPAPQYAGSVNNVHVSNELRLRNYIRATAHRPSCCHADVQQVSLGGRYRTSGHCTVARRSNAAQILRRALQ